MLHFDEPHEGVTKWMFKKLMKCCEEPVTLEALTKPDFGTEFVPW
jgi:hypothetical protein